MSKTFKRIAALALALTLVVCFAVSASAVTVSTKTTYAAADTANVNVEVTVSNIPTGAAYVTYYAGNGSDEHVYVDQKAVTDTSVQFAYQTAATNLKTAVKVGYTNGNAAETDDITANTISYNSTELAVLPTETKDATVTISNYEANTGYIFNDVTATNAKVTYSTESSGTITVGLSNIAGDVELTVNEIASDAAAPTQAIHLANAGVTVTEADDYAAVGNRRITIIGAVKNATEYGVITSSSAITATTTATDLSGYDEWAAKVKSDNGAFAVQIIDDADNMFTAGHTYYSAIYAKNSDGTYTISQADSFTVGQ